MTLGPQQMEEWENLELGSWRKVLIDAVCRNQAERIAYAKHMIEELEKK